MFWEGWCVGWDLDQSPAFFRPNGSTSSGNTAGSARTGACGKNCWVLGVCVEPCTMPKALLGAADKGNEGKGWTGWWTVFLYLLISVADWGFWFGWILINPILLNYSCGIAAMSFGQTVNLDDTVERTFRWLCCPRFSTFVFRFERWVRRNVMKG